MSFFPVIALVGCIIAYCVGSSRENYIKQYNAAVSDWMNGGQEEFSGLFFNMTDASGIEYFHVVNQTDGLYYPTRDSCKMKGDPKVGCHYTGALYYDEDIVWMMHDNYFTIYDREGRLIVNRKVNGFMNITYTPEELRCGHTLKYCQSMCEAKSGTWDPDNSICNVILYANRICFRLKQQDGAWVLDDDNSRKLPPNRNYKFESDGLGCTYDNNWNSIHYGTVHYSNIRINLRSVKDSYLVASAYTHGCSNQANLDEQCFGLPRYQEKSGIVIGFFISLGFVAFVLLCVCILAIASKLKFKKAVRDSMRENKDPLLTGTV